MTLIKRAFLYLLLSVITHVAFSQGVLEFISEKDTEMVIYKPIDGAYNNFYPTDTIKLAKDEKWIYHVDVTDWAIVKCKFPDKMKLDIFIERNDTVYVINRKQDIVFKMILFTKVMSFLKGLMQRPMIIHIYIF